MVQLKADSSYTVKTQGKWFQFQNGSIKRYIDALGTSLAKEFQFQNGSIKSSYRIGRLTNTIVFQFQNGSIKR